MPRVVSGSGTSGERVPDGQFHVARQGGLVVVLAGLALVGCSLAGPVSQPMSESMVAPRTTPGSISASSVPAGLGAPLAVQPVDRVPLSALAVHAVGTAPSGELWVAGSERMDPARVAIYGEWFFDPLVTGVWHGTAGQPGTWYPMGSVEGLAVAPDGRVWIITGTALATFDGGEWRRVLRPGGGVLSGLYGWVIGASTLAVGPDGAVWVAGPTFDSLVRFDGDVTVLTGPGYAADGSVCGVGTVAVTADGTVWTADATPWGYGGCLLKWEGATWTRIRPLGSVDFGVSRLAADTDGGLWAWLLRCKRDEPASEAGWRLTDCGSASLAHFDGSSWVIRSHGPWAGPESGRASIAAIDGTLWLAVNGGLWLFDGDGFFEVPVAPGEELPVTAVLAVHSNESAGPAGTAWVTTADGALHQVRPHPAR